MLLICTIRTEIRANNQTIMQFMLRVGDERSYDFCLYIEFLTVSQINAQVWECYHQLQLWCLRWYRETNDAPEYTRTAWLWSRRGKIGIFKGSPRFAYDTFLRCIRTTEPYNWASLKIRRNYFMVQKTRYASCICMYALLYRYVPFWVIEVNQGQRWSCFSLTGLILRAQYGKLAPLNFWSSS